MLLHVGYHKTGTTWLQRHLFGGAETGFATPWSFDEIVDLLVRPHVLDWDEEAARARLAPPADGMPVISNEELLGNPHAGAYNCSNIADRLARLFPDARIVIVIRRQPSMLASTYKQYVHRGGVLAPRRYFTPSTGGFRIPAFRLTHYEYDRVIEMYHERFGRDAVRVLAFETLVEDPSAFVGAIAEHAGIDRPGPLPAARERVSICAGTAAIQRRLNRWFQRDDVNPAAPLRLERLPYWMRRLDTMIRRIPGAAGARRLDRIVAEVCAGRFAESNRRVQVLTGLPLERLGYDV